MKTLSIVIPAYNEEERLEKTFEALYELKMRRGLKLERVIFVDDGSTDNTKNIIQRFIDSSTVGGVVSQHPRGVLNAVKLQMVTYKQNRGKGYAIIQGMKLSNSDYTLFCDADMSTHVNEIRKFAKYIKQNIPIIIGTRKNGHSTVVRHQPFLRELFGRGFTLLSNIILNTWVSDFTCGFKAYSKEAKESLFPLLRVNGWGFDAELMFLGRISGYDFVEVPVVWSDDRRSKVELWKDVPKSLFDLFYVRLSSYVDLYNNRGWVTRIKPAWEKLKMLIF